MPKFDDIYTLDYTTEELTYFEQEMRKYRLPWITKMHKKYGVPFIRFTFLPALIIIAVLGFIYMGKNNYGQLDWLWTVDKCIALFYIAAFGLFTLVAHVFERVTANKLRRRLGLSQRDFNILVIAFQITGME
jgi:hypothetical protein